MPLGTLYLIPVPLADGAAAKSFTPYLITANITAMPEPPTFLKDYRRAKTLA
jgi:hypothetical protein